MARLRRISDLFLLLLAVQSAAIVLAFGASWFLFEVGRYEKVIKAVENDRYAAVAGAIKEEVEQAVRYIEYQRQIAEAESRPALTRASRRAFDTTKAVTDTTAGVLPQPRVEALVREALRVLPQGSESQLWVFAADGTVVLYPPSPEIEGDNLRARGGEAHLSVLGDFLRLTRGGGADFLSFAWSSLGTEESAAIDYFGYIRPLPLAEWIVCAVLPRAALEAKAMEAALAWLSQVRFGGENYLFAATLDGISVMGPGRGENVWEVTDSRGVKVVQELARLARVGGGYLEYVFPDRFPGAHVTKLSYAKAVPAWNWYIGGGLPIDDIRKAAAAARRDSEAGTRTLGFSLGILLAAVLALALFLSRMAAGRLGRHIDSFVEFFRTSPAGHRSVNLSILRYAELRTIGEATNAMVDAQYRVLQEKEVLLKEVHHRVKNNIQVIQSLLSLQMRASTDPGAFEDSIDRVHAMALVHEQIYGSETFTELEAANYLGKLIDRIARGSLPPGVRLTKHLEPIPVALDTAIPLGLIVNELFSNACKHAFPDNHAGGELTIRFRAQDGEGVAEVADSGPGLPSGLEIENSSTLGLQLVGSLVKQLGGRLEWTNDPGLRWTLRFPLAAKRNE